jgi:hypothetical protein
MLIGATFTDAREARITAQELERRGIVARLEPLADVDPPMATPILVHADADCTEQWRAAAQTLLSHGGAPLFDREPAPTARTGLVPGSISARLR